MTQNEQKALFRFQIIHPLLDERMGKGELTRLVREASQKQYNIPCSRKTSISESTIWAWYKTYLKTRNIASLVPQRRSDRGKRRKITGETADKLLHTRLGQLIHRRQVIVVHAVQYPHSAFQSVARHVCLHAVAIGRVPSHHYQ